MDLGAALAHSFSFHADLCLFLRRRVIPVHWKQPSHRYYPTVWLYIWLAHENRIIEFNDGTSARRVDRRSPQRCMLKARTLALAQVDLYRVPILNLERFTSVDAVRTTFTCGLSRFLPDRHETSSGLACRAPNLRAAPSLRACR